MVRELCMGQAIWIILGGLGGNYAWKLQVHNASYAPLTSEISTEGEAQ